MRGNPVSGLAIHNSESHRLWNAQSDRFVESAGQVAFMQRCTPVVCCEDLDWNIVIRLRTKHERNVEPCTWVSSIGTDVAVELNLCAVDDCRPSEWHRDEDCFILHYRPHIKITHHKQLSNKISNYNTWRLQMNCNLRLPDLIDWARFNVPPNTL